MINEIAAAVGATKNIAELLSKATKVAREKKDQELLSMITEIQSEFIGLREEVESIKKQLDISDKIIRHSDGLYVTIKDDPENIRYCSTCWGDKHKLIQIGSSRCPSCKSILLGYKKDLEQIRKDHNSFIL